MTAPLTRRTVLALAAGAAVAPAAGNAAEPLPPGEYDVCGIVFGHADAGERPAAARRLALAVDPAGRWVLRVLTLERGADRTLAELRGGPGAPELAVLRPVFQPEPEPAPDPAALVAD